MNIFELIHSIAQWFFDLCGAVFDFIVNAFTSLIEFFSMLPIILNFLLGSISYLPQGVYMFATASVIVAITLLILGRSNNG